MINLGHIHIGHDLANAFRLALDKDALLDPGPQVIGQTRLQRVARVLDEAVVHVAPVSLQVRVHAWKWSFHDGSIAEEVEPVSTARELSWRDRSHHGRSCCRSKPRRPERLPKT